ncbi:MAG: hypothetical protein JHC84_06030 [Solirubrobacteraceae bacterium]|nr:hypothetical protein [Solirubrobacteraceae bacterium]
MDEVSTGASTPATQAETATAVVTAPSSPPEAVPTPTATAPATTAQQGGAAAPEAEAQEGGAGDEEGIRVPVDLLVSADAVAPPTVTVPAFLPLQVTARATDATEHRVMVAGATLTVGASGTASARLDGLRRGTYPVTVDGRALGELIVGDEPGP